MEEITFEEALARLERIVADLEQGEMTLEDSLAAFQEGVQMLRLCIAKLNRFEEQVEVLMEAYYSEAPPWLGNNQEGGSRSE